MKLLQKFLEKNPHLRKRLQVKEELQIQSETSPYVKYKVVIDDQGNMACACPAFAFNKKKDCKHIKKVKNYGK